MHGSYTDLLMDSSQLEAFGVDSKWTPGADEVEPARTAGGSPKEEDVPMREVRSFSARRRERDDLEERKAPMKEDKRPASKMKKERPPSTKPDRPKSVQRAPTPKRELKKNQRLSEYGKEQIERPKERPKNDPFGLPVDYG
uniref:BLVR domain-containing protein n=1 Tax=Steinernema glaseri TaxID=37863 RepID=A0A1I7Y7L7_9BILA